MAHLALIRSIHLLPGRESEGVSWLDRTEPVRRAAGQVAQYILRGQVDLHDYQWVQIWHDFQTYDGWRRSPERARLVSERARYMTHGAIRPYDVLE